MKLLKQIWWGALLFLLPLHASDQVAVDLQIIVPDAEVIRLGDLDFSNLGNAPAIFYLTLRNPEPGPAVRLQLRFEMRYNNQVIARSISNWFTLPITEGITFNNVQLNTGSAVIPGTGGETIEFNSYDIAFDLVEDLEQKVLATGQLPAGKYLFYIEAIREDDPGNPIPDPNLDDNVIVVTNPTYVQPLFPGNRADSGTPPQIGTTVPYFQWESDANIFNLYVYEKMESDRTLEDVFSHDPILHLEGYPNKIFQYPLDTTPLTFLNNRGEEVGRSVGPIRLLEPGKTYYWVVEAVIPTAGEPLYLKSEVYQFRIFNLNDVEAFAQNILNFLRQVLGPDFDRYMNQLTNYSPTGTILINNAPVGRDALFNFLEKFRNGKIKITDVRVE